MSQNLTEALASMQKVTEKNLEILKALNDSFYSKREHVTAVVDGVTYNIPSYLYLESKIGDLENNFENLVNAPKTGTAAFVFDGNSQEIQMKGFSVTPDAIALEQVPNFDIEQNKIFKDFLSPNPYIRLNLDTIGTDVTEVVVKKIDIKNENLLSQINGISSESSTVDFPSVKKIMSGYKSDEDYVEYDTIRRLPIRSDAPTGTYTIKTIDSTWTDGNLIQHYTLTLNEKLNYWVESGTLQKQIVPGDELITSSETVKLHVDRTDYQKNLIEVTVENGAFADLTEYNVGYQNNDYATLKYFSIVGQDVSRYIDIPLEEDKNLMVFVAVLDTRLNIQGPWGTGLLIDTDNLTIEEDGIIYTFTDYYKTHINNVGDTLYGLTKMFSTDMFNWTSEEYNLITGEKPVIDTGLLQVIEINSHLNASESVKKIRSLHNQKSGYKSDLNTVQADIDKLTNLLSEMSFSDTNENRVIYETQLTNLNAQKAELNKNISEIIDEISDNVNNADVPIENAKYHIRGFYDVSRIEETTGHKVIRIDVEYRYKNRNRSEGTATSFSIDDAEDSKTYIYSDWNKMPSFTDMKHPDMTSKTVQIRYDASTDEQNVPSFNQIDIPITQGETVDIRLRVQYSDGFPFVETLSAWSPIVNIEFPEEFTTNVPLMRIIETNNEDAEKYRFRNILESEGVLKHVQNEVQDQDKVYFHQPENIASGFFTAERRIIPLKDKLTDMSEKIDVLMDEIYSMDPSQLTVTVSDNSYTINLTPYGQSTFYAPAYSDTISSRDDNGNAVDIINITILNPTSHNIKLFTMFPGNSKAKLSSVTHSKFNSSDYSDGTLSVWGYSDNTELFNETDHAGTKLFEQHQNQLVYMRLNNPYDNTPYYTSDSTNVLTTDDVLYGVYNTSLIRKTGTGNGASLIMNISSLDGLVTEANSRYYTLRPGDSISIPVEFRYQIDETMGHIRKTISFDLWTSLFGEPANYTLKVRSNYIDDISDRNRRQSTGDRYTPTVFSNAQVPTDRRVVTSNKRL